MCIRDRSIKDRVFFITDLFNNLSLNFDEDTSNKAIDIMISILAVTISEAEKIAKVNDKKTMNVENESEYEFDKTTGTINNYKGSNKEIIIPEKIEGIHVKIIGDFAFSNMEIDKLTLPDGIEYIKGYAFAGNNIEIIDFPKSLKAIDEMAFSFNQINKLKLSEGIEYIGDCAFVENKIDSFNIPNSLKYIGESAFYSCLLYTSPSPRDD